MLTVGFGPQARRRPVRRRLRAHRRPRTHRLRAHRRRFPWSLPSSMPRETLPTIRGKNWPIWSKRWRTRSAWALRRSASPFLPDPSSSRFLAACHKRLLHSHCPGPKLPPSLSTDILRQLCWPLQVDITPPAVANEDLATTAIAFAAKLETKLATAELATAVLGVTVGQPPTFTLSSFPPAAPPSPPPSPSPPQQRSVSTPLPEESSAVVGKEDELSGGAIAGIVIGGLLVMAALVTAAMLLRRRRLQQSQPNVVVKVEEDTAMTSLPHGGAVEEQRKEFV